jgi:hypothetical protein
MKRHFLSRATQACPLTVLLVVLFAVIASGTANADQVQMQNGDLYSGKVVSLNGDTLVLQSEVAGMLRLPRAKVALLTLGTNSPAVARPSALTNHSPAMPAAAGTNVPPSEMAAALRQLGAHTNLIQRVQAQFLADAGPEANAKFNELLGGLMTGKVSLEELRAQAQSAATQMHEARKELGDDAGVMIDGYLAILDHFLKETGPPVGASTNLNHPIVNSKPATAAQN